MYGIFISPILALIIVNCLPKNYCNKKKKEQKIKMFEEYIIIINNNMVITPIKTFSLCMIVALKIIWNSLIFNSRKSRLWPVYHLGETLTYTLLLFVKWPKHLITETHWNTEIGQIMGKKAKEDLWHSNLWEFSHIHQCIRILDWLRQSLFILYCYFLLSL